MAKLQKAKVKLTGKMVDVYKLKSGGYCDYSDCKTTYQIEELDFIKNE